MKFLYVNFQNFPVMLMPNVFVRAIMQADGMIADLVRNLQTESHKLKMLCASAIFRLAEEDDSRHLVRLHGGLELLGNI